MVTDLPHSQNLLHGGGVKDLPHGQNLLRDVGDLSHGQSLLRYGVEDNHHDHVQSCVEVYVEEHWSGKRFLVYKEWVDVESE